MILDTTGLMGITEVFFPINLLLIVEIWTISVFFTPKTNTIMAEPIDLINADRMSIAISLAKDTKK